MRHLKQLWRMWYPIVGAAVACVLALKLHAEHRVFGVLGTQAAIFGGLLTFAALLASVLLALLGIIASLDARPIVQDIRRAGHYPELVTYAFTPLRSFIVLAVVCLAALLASSTDREEILRTLVAATAAFTAWGILGTVRFASLLIRVMLDPAGSEPPRNLKDTPEGARARGAGDVKPDPRSAQATIG